MNKRSKKKIAPIVVAGFRFIQMGTMLPSSRTRTITSSFERKLPPSLPHRSHSSAAAISSRMTVETTALQMASLRRWARERPWGRTPL